MENYMMKTADNEFLDIIGKSTFDNLNSMWLENLQINEKDFGFNDTISGIKTEHSKSLVLAAGPESKKVFGDNFNFINKERKNLTIVACDGALKMLSQNNCIPNYVVSVDGDPIIANFYKFSQDKTLKIFYFLLIFS